MTKKQKNEELQSRRQFFKKAAKGALPILGAIALANLPHLAGASTAGCTCSGACVGGCNYTCYGTCSGKCMGGCQGTCQSADVKRG